VECKAPRSTTGGPDVSRRPKTASADRHEARKTSSLLPYGLEDERGRFLPTALMGSSL
jgi:hypothetical protein